MFVVLVRVICWLLKAHVQLCCVLCGFFILWVSSEDDWNTSFLYNIINWLQVKANRYGYCPWILHSRLMMKQKKKGGEKTLLEVYLRIGLILLFMHSALVKSNWLQELLKEPFTVLLFAFSLTAPFFYHVRKLADFSILQHIVLLQMSQLEGKYLLLFWSVSRMILCQNMEVERLLQLLLTAWIRNLGIYLWLKS